MTAVTVTAGGNTRLLRREAHEQRRTDLRVHSRLMRFSSTFVAAPTDGGYWRPDGKLNSSGFSGMWQHKFFATRERMFQQSCGAVIAAFAFGNFTSKYMLAAMKTIRRFSAQTPQPGWCKGAPELTMVPVTLNTDLAARDLRKLLAHDRDVSVLHTASFDALDVEASAQWNRLGPPIHHWYHCQVFKYAPYKLMLYLDADATICEKNDVRSLFRDAAENSWDLAYEHSAVMGGYLMTHGRRDWPRPQTVISPSDLQSWKNTPEANAGAVLFAATSSQKFANEFCSYQHEAFRLDTILGDQFAFREALWDNRHSLKVHVFKEDPTTKISTLAVNRICRYTTNCNHGCNVVHGWKYFK